MLKKTYEAGNPCARLDGSNWIGAR